LFLLLLLLLLHPGVRNIVMSVCLSTLLKNHKANLSTSPKTFVHVAYVRDLAPSCGAAICYVLPVLWVGAKSAIYACLVDVICAIKKQKAFEKYWAHSPLRAAARHLF